MGPSFYEARRAQWLMPTPEGAAAAASIDADAQDSRRKLEIVMEQPGAEEDEMLWRQYLHAVHEGLIGGKRFKKGVGLGIAVKILRAGWLRDGTWDTASAASLSTGPPPAAGRS